MNEEFIELPRSANDITGQRFSRLIAIGPVRPKGRQGIYWFCQCDCGKTALVTAAHLMSGGTKSCGCLLIELQVKRLANGESCSRLHNTWRAMIKRCSKPRHKDYPRYGGRGISVCHAWRGSFVAFRNYVSALPHYGEKGYSLDRIQNDGNYEPDNVRWATPSEQSRNRRNRRNRMITFEGRAMCLADWSAELKMEARTIAYRLKRGWSVENALTTVPRKYLRHPG